MSPKPHILNAAASEGGRGFVFRVEDQGIAPFPDVPGNGGDDGGRHRAPAAEEKQISEVEGVLLREVKAEEMPRLASVGAGQQQMVDVFHISTRRARRQA
jgi:hypothetical protein